MLIPLLAPHPDGASVGLSKIASALGKAAVKAAVCIGGIITGGRLLVRPVYRRIANTGSAEIFSACTLLVVLGTSVLTQAAGLSLALGAFLVRRRCQGSRIVGFGFQRHGVQGGVLHADAGRGAVAGGGRLPCKTQMLTFDFRI